MCIRDREQEYGVEYKIAEGVFFTDFRKGKSVPRDELANFAPKKEYVPGSNFENLKSDYEEFDKKITKLQETVDEIKGIQGFQFDEDLYDAMKEDLQLIAKYYDYLILIIEAMNRINPTHKFIEDDAINNHRIKKLEALEYLKSILNPLGPEVAESTKPTKEEGIFL
eukprot:TRINITY_DN6278_c0_g1_i4.p1 TRINITY_DN6278_c0_g1~~TRINITY_DN6278_c0_g1_i4.p1  ORF type:complete len:183 (-),score=65.66 TRINITY_DN6278_c0_g1_i4:103-603(-)